MLANGSSQGTGFQPCYGAVGTGGGTGTCNANLVNEGHDEGMEFANGNYALLASALQYANDTTAPVVGTDVTADGKTPTYSVKFTEQRGVLDLLHHRRLDADDGLHRVEAEPAARAAGCRSTSPPGTKLKWIARRLQGQHVRGQVADARPDRHARHGRRQRPATLALTLGAPASFGAVHPRRRQGLHRLHHRHRDLDRR